MNQSPNELSEQLEILAHDFSILTDKLVDVLTRKPEVWNKLRPDFKSDTACERAWGSTYDGLIEMECKLKLKALEKQMSAIRTRLRIMSDEAHNLF